MQHRLIVLVGSIGDADWASAFPGLQAIAEQVGDAELVELDARRAVVVIAGVDADTVELAAAELLPRWLDQHGLAVVQTPWRGATIFRSEPDAALARVDALDDAARIELFVSGVIDAQTVWGLYGKTWARSFAAGDVEALPLWPSRELAARCIDDGWPGFVPRSIDLPAFLEQWLTGMHEDGIVAVLVPTPGRPGAVVTAEGLAAAIGTARDEDLDDESE
ncbi:MAG: DUF2750 domain-containing protein [Deltaproteobacteria bacterium]|nr:DUF2750 domain-containing protein [Nannocystaceae bacterium]